MLVYCLVFVFVDEFIGNFDEVISDIVFDLFFEICRYINIMFVVVIYSNEVVVKVDCVL